MGNTESSSELTALKQAKVGLKPEISNPPDTKTENDAAAYSTTGNEGLDLFILAVRNAPEDYILTLFSRAWTQDPKQAVAIVMNLRDIRGGKGERLIVWYILLWLRTYKPLTYLSNLSVFIDLGYIKDLCQITRLVHQRSLPSLGEKEAVELECIAEMLRKDVETSKISLVAKWAPSEKTFFDRKENGNQAKTLAKLCYPDSKTPQKDYRKQLTEFREELKIVERLMSEDRWGEINFGHVPAKAHRLLRSAFKKHEPERYFSYLKNVSLGREKINVAGTQPHELVNHYLNNNNELDETIENQWKTLLSKLKESGVLSKSMAIVDVSGSMVRLPLQVAVSLGLVVASLTSEEFRGTLISFSSTPVLHEIPDSSLYDQVMSVTRMDWTANTDLLKVFDLLLDRAISHEVSPENMIDTLFIFTDMQFDSAEKGNWKTTYTHIQEKYKENGYTVPNIVFWNLRAAQIAFPTKKDTPGVALVSGFSAELLKIFMEGGELTPEEVMKRAVAPYLEKVYIDPSEV